MWLGDFHAGTNSAVVADMSRSLLILASVSLLSLAVGCGDASAPAFRKEGTMGQGTGSGSGTPSNAGDPSSSPPSSDPSANPPSTPPAPPPSGAVFIRVANFFATAADACVSTDGGATWVGPLMKQLAGKSLDPNTVSARTSMKNAHFTIRAVTGSDCKTGVGADVKTDIPGEWPATIVLGQKSGTPETKVLIDEPSISNTTTFVRLVHAANWAMDADLGTNDDDGNYSGIFGDTPYLGTAKQGTLSKQGYATLDPLGGAPLILQTTTSKEVRLTINANTDVDEKYTLFTVGTDKQTSLLACDDEATPGNDHLTPCSLLNDGDTLAPAGN